MHLKKHTTKNNNNLTSNTYLGPEKKNHLKKSLIELHKVKKYSVPITHQESAFNKAHNSCYFSMTPTQLTTLIRRYFQLGQMFNPTRLLSTLVITDVNIYVMDRITIE